ncbi:hypothetical protein [Ectopseudomonas guguanensis]|jgi:hypothetical protein|uniref:hypothetical protein n=1 Tax=Ectopseudomonas guguanensis TaxID=1198456 RepID=UPI0023566C7E|nr:MULTISPECIES: hypothetical protein [Pseudomonas]
MKILVQPLDQGGERRWQVQMDRHRVSFRSEEQARAFVTTLQARLRAPHNLPEQRQAG